MTCDLFPPWHHPYYWLRADGCVMDLASSAFPSSGIPDEADFLKRGKCPPHGRVKCWDEFHFQPDSSLCHAHGCSRNRWEHLPPELKICEFPYLMGFIRQKWKTNESTEYSLRWIPAPNGDLSSNEWCNNHPSSICDEFPLPLGFTRYRLNVQPSIKSPTGCWDKFQNQLKFVLVHQFLCHTFSRRNEFPHPMGFMLRRFRHLSRVGNSMECSSLQMVNCE